MDDQTDKREEGVMFLDLLILLLKRKKIIFVTTAAFGIVAALVSLLLPTMYRSEVKFLPHSQTPAGTIGQVFAAAGLGNIPGFITQGLGAKPMMELYVELLKTRLLLDRMIDRFDLMKESKAKYREDARKYLLRRVTVDGDKNSGLVTVKVDARDRRRAAEMANAFVEELKRIAGGLAITEAAQRRLFFEEQLKEAKAALSRAEEGFRGFQEKTGALDIDSQARTVIEGIARLRAQIAAKEVQLKVLRTYATEQNPDVQKVEEELRGLQAELGRLESGDRRGHDPLMPTGRMPSVGTEYLRKLREFKYNETLFELLSKQYEVARLDEARNAVVIQVVDPAVPSEKRYKPKRLLIVLGAMAAGLFVSLFVSFMGGGLERSSEDSAVATKLELVRRYASLKGIR
jgi:uncharacterized protein involved in exopolysaccharide biosynthesis